MLISHRLFAIATLCLALKVHVLDPGICLKVFFFPFFVEVSETVIGFLLSV